jgi:hypothetical protein
MQAPPARVKTSDRLGAAGRSEGLALGSLAFAPLVLAAILAWVTPAGIASLIAAAAMIWSGALLAFLAGARRGLTFSEAAPPARREIVSMLWLFGAAVATLWLAPNILAIPMAIFGFASLGVLDFRAARRQEAPGYFAAFRPLQAAVAMAALIALLAAFL